MPTPRCFDAKPKESWGLKPFCPAWPTYALPAEPSSLLSDAVRRALRPFAAGVSAADLDAALVPHVPRRQGVPAAPVDVRSIGRKQVVLFRSLYRIRHEFQSSPSRSLTRACVAVHSFVSRDASLLPTHSHPDPVFPACGGGRPRRRNAP